MKVSRTKFVISFLVLAFAFQFITNSVLGPEIRLFPGDGEWFPGMGSSIGWKNILAAILYPVKYVLIGPLTFLGHDPDPVPPILFIAFSIYWSVIAVILYFIVGKIQSRKEHKV